ncbi:hypothetical protein RAH32_20090 [Paracoccus sp. WLY502]|uniref:helix-turn-helix transcriptional regulator n=1 Tax=Paracoccus yibinensis TaxID=3068891 RepID=UPI002796C3F8|nr:hypothetical protein [Paracoccus sp. WLY502]MDQ1902725.1 hypothetical protein [Paracoccus sp. WLY502]
MSHDALPPDATELIDHLYAALFNEAPWQDFVTRSCGLMPNGKAVLFFHNKASGAGAMSLTGGLDEGMVKNFNDYYHEINPWVNHAMERPLGKVMQADEMLPREVLKRTEFYQDYLRPQDIETGLGVTLHRDAGLHVFFSIVSADVTQEQLEQARRSMTLLVPHLYRAFRIRSRGTEPDFVAGSGSTLQIDENLRVLTAEAEALRLLAQTEALSINPRGRLVSKDPDFLSLLQHVLSSEKPPSLQHLHVKRRTGGLPLHVCVYRPGQPGAASSERISCFIQLEDPAVALPVGVRRFCSLHGLTGAEAGVVAGLIAGLTLNEIAVQRRTSPDTVRTQLKAIFWKTGCKRQADLVCQVAVMAQSYGWLLTAPVLIPDQ